MLVCDVVVVEVCNGVFLIDVVCMVVSWLEVYVCKSCDVLLMGIMLVVLWICDEVYELVWVGDSCIYVFGD